MMKKKGKALLGISLLLAMCPEPIDVQAETLQQMRILSQEEMEDFTAPPKEYRADTGDLYDLKDWELEEVPGKAEWKEIEQEVIYEQVEAADEIPHSIPYKEVIEGQEVKGDLVEAGKEVVGERWSNDFEVLLTFHSYGAQSYRLGNLFLTVLEEFPPAGEYEEQLLGILGLPLADYKIAKMEWRGEPYQDESGELCRNAAALGSKKVRDYRVIYRGELACPKPLSYQLKTVYEKREGSQVSLAEKPEPAALPEEHPQAAALWSWIHTGVAVTIALGFLGLALGLFLLGLSKRREYRKHADDRHGVESHYK